MTEATDKEKLAFAQAFLLSLARRIEDASLSWSKGKDAAEDCREVAKAISQIHVGMPLLPNPMK